MNPTQKEVAEKMLAKSLVELNPARTEEEWLDHVRKTAGDPKAFFGANGEGLEEYNAFVRTFDKDTHEKQRNVRTRRR